MQEGGVEGRKEGGSEERKEGRKGKERKRKKRKKEAGWDREERRRADRKRFCFSVSPTAKGSSCLGPVRIFKLSPNGSHTPGQRPTDPEGTLAVGGVWCVTSNIPASVWTVSQVSLFAGAQHEFSSSKEKYWRYSPCFIDCNINSYPPAIFHRVWSRAVPDTRWWRQPLPPAWPPLSAQAPGGNPNVSGQGCLRTRCGRNVKPDCSSVGFPDNCW